MIAHRNVLPVGQEWDWKGPEHGSHIGGVLGLE